MHTLFEGPVPGPVRAFGPIRAMSFDREPPIPKLVEVLTDSKDATKYSIDDVVEIA